MRFVPSWLRLLALAEPVTLAVLVTNAALGHKAAVAAALGPVHGGCYLAIIIGFLVREGTANRTRALAAIPGIGGLLATRTIQRAARPTAGEQTQQQGHAT